jgi:hypothetical protein
MSLSANRGEWAEIYTFFKLLADEEYMLPMKIW